MKVRTVQSGLIWKSSDGQRTIWEVTLKADDGRDYTLKTYSQKIGTIGYEGEVRSYVNPRGERFVRGVPPQNGYGGKGQPRDDDAIRAQWAIGQAINLASVKMDKEAITLPVIEKYAKELFATVSRVKGEPLDADRQNRGNQYIEGFTGGSESTNPKVEKTHSTNPARLQPGAPVWPSEHVDDGALDRYITATLAETEQ